MRLIFVSKRTDDVEKEAAESRRRELENQRQEQNRREDLDQEKGIWNDTLQARLSQEWAMEKALAEADVALEEYRKRFQ